MGKEKVVCNFKYNNNSILQACADDRNVCLKLTDGKLNMKWTHKYYSQAQHEIFVTKSEFCVFVEWMQKDCCGSDSTRCGLLDNTSDNSTGVYPKGFSNQAYRFFYDDPAHLE